MEPALALVVVLLAAPAVVLACLTASGSRRRGARARLAVMSGVLFPVTWVVWYVRDELDSADSPHWLEHTLGSRLDRE